MIPIIGYIAISYRFSHNVVNVLAILVAYLISILLFIASIILIILLIIKEWLFNGKIVEGNKTTSYKAKVSSEQNYCGVISVRFEVIQG